MADNAIPKGNKQLITLAGDMAAGLTKLGAELKITQLTPAELSGALAAFITAEGAYSGARGHRNEIYATFHAAELAMDTWLDAVRNVLRTHFGARYSQDWAQAGFTNNTTARCRAGSRIGWRWRNWSRSSWRPMQNTRCRCSE